MISNKEIMEIRKFLKKSVNPLFFFDDDPDGLTSYLLLKKKYKKGKGVCIKGSHANESIFLRKVEEHNPDLMVILDRPPFSKDLIDSIHVPIIFIDHHEPVKRKGIHYYNPMLKGKKDNRPTSYWAWKIVNENAWLAVVGIIGDWHVPDKNVLKDFKFKDMIKGGNSPQELIYDTPYGKLVKIFSFALKGSTTSTKECINAMLKIKSPLEILGQKSNAGKLIYEKFQKHNKEYEELLNEALSCKEKGDVFVFTYAEKRNSYTSDLSNELLYKIKNDVLILGRVKGGKVKMSLRSKKKSILPVLKKALLQIEGYGGGHAKACGASVKVKDFTKFVNIIKKEYKKAKS